MRKELTISQLDSEHVELLPARETLGYWGNHNWAQVYASNSSTALNAASHFAMAKSAAYQSIYVHQH